MGLVLTVLTIAVALARRSLVARLRGVPALRQPHRRGAVGEVAGAYVMWFAVVEIRLGSGGTGDTITDRVWGWSFDVQRWVQDVGPSRLASGPGRRGRRRRRLRHRSGRSRPSICSRKMSACPA